MDEGGVNAPSMGIKLVTNDQSFLALANWAMTSVGEMSKMFESTRKIKRVDLCCRINERVKTKSNTPGTDNSAEKKWYQRNWVSTTKSWSITMQTRRRLFWRNYSMSEASLKFFLLYRVLFRSNSTTPVTRANSELSMKKRRCVNYTEDFLDNCFGEDFY